MVGRAEQNEIAIVPQVATLVLAVAEEQAELVELVTTMELVELVVKVELEETVELVELVVHPLVELVVKVGAAETVTSLALSTIV